MLVRVDFVVDGESSYNSFRRTLEKLLTHEHTGNCFGLVGVFASFFLSTFFVFGLVWFLLLSIRIYGFDRFKVRSV